ncbi:uncharacterized protein C8Q71DRAFT_363608 [Rhodofomes roseus]|uniref:Uncharacterized protein n=1 Tax=Rhodofomes roseus TaxID=34475 RepID=A0ABQ8K147_9APHY|nr:uncharacterized protein C8Q71DRAFT_363608 [Rhodofomes roseus]KAH9830419.1 hypothetical protein C8Q71DRAFT_363608 [Rhodofomes roseus]
MERPDRTRGRDQDSGPRAAKGSVRCAQAQHKPLRRYLSGRIWRLVMHARRTARRWTTPAHCRDDSASDLTHRPLHCPFAVSSPPIHFQARISDSSLPIRPARRRHDQRGIHIPVQSIQPGNLGPSHRPWPSVSLRPARTSTFASRIRPLGSHRTISVSGPLALRGQPGSGARARVKKPQLSGASLDLRCSNGADRWSGLGGCCSGGRSMAIRFWTPGCCTRISREARSSLTKDPRQDLRPCASTLFAAVGLYDAICFTSGRCRSTCSASARYDVRLISPIASRWYKLADEAAWYVRP